MKELEFIQNLINHSLCYGIKSPDMDLYDFGFKNIDGNMGDTVDWRGEEECTYFLHTICRFKMIWKIEDCRVDEYYEDTPCEKFHSDISRLLGLRVRRVGLSDKNDLWLDFGDCWIVFATFENKEESWRLFTVGVDGVHLIASDDYLCFSD